MTRPDSRGLWLLPIAAALVLGGCGSPPSALDVPAAPRLAAPPVAEGGTAATAVASPLERLIALGRSDNRVQEHLRHLCLEIGPRLTGSTRLQAACEWARDTFASFGLRASLEPWGEFPVGFERGPWRGGIVAPEPLELEFHTMAWTSGTDGPKRGPALAFPASEEELEAIAARIAGAWLVRPPAAALEDETGAVVFEKPAQPSGRLVEKVQALIVEKGGLGEVRGARGELLVTGGNHRIQWDELPKLVQVRVRKDHHDELWRRMRASGSEGTVELEFDVDNRFVRGPIPQVNVIADLVGRSKPDEFVIVGGHLDSWDGAQGAVDNGTGCATTIEAARLLVESRATPARTIRFILWTGEEQGLFGSEAYVKQHAAELPRISALFNHDEGTNWLSGLSVTPAMMPAMRTACAPLFGLHPEFDFELVEVDGLPSFVGSDNDPFVQAGVPGFFWRQSGRSDYERYHHTQHDVFEAAIPEYQEHSALVVALAALGVADLPEPLDRTGLKDPEPRRMGVQLDGTKLTEVAPASRAEQGGLRVGDVILAIDGKEMRSQGSVSSALRAGGSRKEIRVKRGEETLEVVLDWSDDPDEPRRLEQARKREEREAARRAEREAKQAEAKKP
jgi:hypothetical protein